MSEKRPFRFGVVAGSASSREEWQTLARRAEELGYATFLLTDHFVNEFPPLVALMAAADATTTLRVGTFVFDNDFRHPVGLAKEIATLDLLSGGRFELGIGAGWHQAEYKQAGLPFDDAPTRINRLEESLHILKQFFTQETVDFSGTHYTVTGLHAMPKPVQRPHPPIFIGGGGKKVLSLAARTADIIGIHLKANKDGSTDAFDHSEAAVAQKVDLVRAVAGKRFSEIELNLLIRAVIITENQQQAAEHYLQERARATTTVEQLLASPYVFIGDTEQLLERLLRLREQFGISYFVVGDDSMEAFAPAVAHLAGQ